MDLKKINRIAAILPFKSLKELKVGEYYNIRSVCHNVNFHCFFITLSPDFAIIPFQYWFINLKNVKNIGNRVKSRMKK